jgi:fengycin family lipopeptide synthetase C
MYPVLLDMVDAAEGDLGKLIRSVKETLRQVPNKGIGYGILKHLTSAENKEGISFALKPEIIFNYLGQLGD